MKQKKKVLQRLAWMQLKWEAPYEQELLTSEMKAKLIADVEKSNGPGKVNIKFC